MARKRNLLAGAGRWAQRATRDVYRVSSKAVSQVYRDVRSVPRAINNRAEQVVNRTADIGVASARSFTLPLAVGAVAAAYYAFKK